MKLKELKQKSSEELQKRLEEIRSLLRQESFKTSGARSKNVKLRSMNKKEIARILTLIRERENNG